MGCMTYILEKPIVRRVAAGTVAVGLIVAVAADAYDGTKDFSFKGAPSVISSVGSTLATGPGQVFTYVENTIIGPPARAIPPERYSAAKMPFVFPST